MIAGAPPTIRRINGIETVAEKSLSVIAPIPNIPSSLSSE